MKGDEQTYDVNEDAKIYCTKFIPGTNYLGIAGTNTPLMKIQDVKDKNVAKKPLGYTTVNSDLQSLDFYQDKRDNDAICRAIVG